MNVLATLPSIPTTGDSGLDTQIALYVAAFVGIGLVVAVFSQIKTGAIVVTKVQKYGNKLV